ncbi:hypothetical protein, variant 1 [Aphanomyces invadans]|uniref:Uncharacterized protein n=1 Tax=Aphanomyces invadans TaxID=157072 RepID=A0A024ULN1_9STRA|nr:hypothetical protein, variant 1 [Aphanomyces invadans]ETW06762.1 hypothetical protein, variant 1 [Aphanomyces invadans]|eukprot:XP_008864837.1 hypothetical protein, variant 1 [Aphanomyces invadans]
MQYHTRYKARVCRRFWRVDIANEFRLETQQGSHTQLQACTTRVPRECDRATHQVDQWPRTHQEHGPCEREDAAAEAKQKTPRRLTKFAVCMKAPLHLMFVCLTSNVVASISANQNV